MKNNRFRRGESTFKCHICRRGTRYTGVQSVGSSLCPECYELAGLENMVQDGEDLGTVVAERDSLLREIAKKGGDVDMVKKCCSILWRKPKEPEVERTYVDLY